MSKKIFLFSALVLILLFGAVTPARAQGIISGDTVPAGVKVDDDLVLYGETVTIDGDVNGNVFALGGTVTVNGKVDGNLYAISQQITINGEVTDGVYGMALELAFGPEGKVGRNAAFLGLTVTMPQGSSIGRDLTGIFLLGAQFAGNVSRDTTAVIGPLEFVRLIVRMLNIEAPAFLSPQTALPGAFKLASPVAYKVNGQGILDSLLSQRWLFSMIRDYIALLVVGLLVLWLAPSQLRKWGNKAMHSPFSSLGMGLVIVVVGTIGLALLWTLFLAIALGLGKIGFSGLGSAVGLLGFFTVGTAGVIVYVLVAFISKLVFAFQAGFLILKKYDRQSFWYRLGVLALGLLIYVILVAIPYIGWAVAVIVVLLGTGAIYLVLNDGWKPDEQPAVNPAPAAPQVVESKPVAPVSAPAETPAGLNDKPAAEIPADDKSAKSKTSKK